MFFKGGCYKSLKFHYFFEWGFMILESEVFGVIFFSAIVNKLHESVVFLCWLS